MKASKEITAHVVSSQGKLHLAEYLKGETDKGILALSKRTVAARVADGIAVLLRKEVVVMAREGLDAAEAAGVGLSKRRKNKLAESAAEELIQKGLLFAAACTVRQFDVPARIVSRLKPDVLEKMEQARAGKELRQGRETGFGLIDHKDQKASGPDGMAKLTRFSFLGEQHGQLMYVMEVFRIKREEIRMPGA